MSLIDMRIFSTQLILYIKTTDYSLTAHSYWKFKNSIFQILRNDVIDNINKFNLATVFASIKCLKKEQDK